MSILGAFLVAVGVADLWRATGRRSPLGAAALALLTLAGVAALAELDTTAQRAQLVAVSLAAIGWSLASARALDRGRGEPVALAVLAATVAGLLICSPWAGHAGGPLARWMDAGALTRLHRATADTLLLVVGLGLAQLSTANLVVRLALSAIGALRPPGQPQVSDQLKGGRLLGPMERLFVFGLGLAGQVTAASLVIAAKGLIRFPELTTKPSDQEEVKGIGIDAVTEYFLVGSFVSWLLATGSFALVALS